MTKRNELNAPICFFVILLGLLLASPVGASENKAYRPYLSFNIASSHMGTDVEYNEFNPGVGIGLAFATAHGGEFLAEVGGYKNSFSTRSMYGAVTYELPVAKLAQNTELRLGGFLGLVTYPKQTQKFRDGGAIMVGEAVLLGGISATIRHNDRYDLRARIVPGGASAKAIATLQLGIRY